MGDAGGAIERAAAVLADVLGEKLEAAEDRITELEDVIWKQNVRIAELKTELIETHAEIARHHRDFEAIRAILDHAEVDGSLDVQAVCRSIYAIVG